MPPRATSSHTAEVSRDLLRLAKGQLLWAELTQSEKLLRVLDLRETDDGQKAGLRLANRVKQGIAQLDDLPSPLLRHVGVQERRYVICRFEQRRPDLKRRDRDDRERMRA
jgi:hypothetical protein